MINHKENEIIKVKMDGIKEKKNLVKDWSRLEAYISTISSRFLIRIDIDKDIKASLRDMGILSGASRVYLFLFNKEKKVMNNTHEWCAEGISPQIQILQNFEFETLPWWMKQLTSGNLINISNLGELPYEARHTKEFLELQGVKSVLAYPLYVKGVSAGYIGFNNISTASEWSEEAFAILRISSQIIGNALERDTIERMLKSSEKKYRLIIENINDLISIIDLHLKFNYINENSLKKLLGYTSKEIIGRACFDFIHPNDKEKAREYLTTDFQSRTSTIELRIEHKEGNWIWFECRGQRFANKEGARNTLLIMRDISNRISVEMQYKNLFDNSPNAILLVNFNGIVIDANATSKKLFGYEKEEFIDLPINSLKDIFSQEAKDIFTSIFQTSFNKGFPIPIEIQVKNKGGYFIWVIFQASLIKQINETLIQFIFLDITEKKKGELITEKFKEELEVEVEKRTKELNDAIEQQKLYLEQIIKSSQIKTEFMATISHELRTPLNAIIGFTDLLLEGIYGELNEEQIEFMNDIKSSAEHQFDMIKRILDISKIESGQVSLNIQKFSLNSTIEQIKSNLKPLYSNKSLKLKVIGLDEEIFIAADPIRFKEILFNLLSNAIKFTIDGNITLLIKEDYYNWIFRVRDTGIGIANKDFPLIFKEFRRVESTYVKSTPGTGLGLSLTKRLIELHGGEISFFSVLGVGSTFTFNIPKKKE